MSAPGAGPPPMPPPTYGMPPPAYGMPPPMPMQERTALPVAGGALLLVAGLLGLIWWGMVLSIGAMFFGIPFIGAAICGGIGILFSILPLIGGIFAIQRKMWGLAVVGGILGIFSLGFFLGSILSLVGLILVAVSRREFA